jgi:hypothetical protein
MKPGNSMPHFNGSPIIPILSRINPIPRTDAYFFKVHSNIVQSNSKALCDVSEQPCFYSVRLLASLQTPKLKDHSWPAVHDCLFNIFAANLHIWRPSPPFSTRGDAPCHGDRNSRMERFYGVR